ncbi:S-layer homology domain-containing protein [Bacillus tuaregi]|uniref:S-layer homology domain-containing protein n=1 Tax=Bacillus tuaregi TaxID=1816695 RepID=UPI0008F8B87F|nr:S-layer homology domain-containing protein [Bacillus tuaregi]
MKKASFLVLLAVLVFSGFGGSAFGAGATFSDLTEEHRFFDEMVYLEEEGIITGFPDGTFRPEGVVTRGAVAIMIGRALDLNGEQRATKFTDVGPGQAASGYIASAVEKGIIQGYPDGTYKPNETVTRGQMAIFLSRAFELTVEVDAPFKDISPSMISYPYIKRIIAENLTQGYPDNTFRPNDKVTRAQFSAFLARALNDDFKVELPVSYVKDIDNIYYYHSSENGEFSYVYADEEYPDWNLWNVNDEFGGSYQMVERQDEEGYKVGAPYSEYQLVLAKPVEIGTVWDIEYGDEILASYVITSTGLTLTTPAGTFTDVVEVKDKTGLVTYFAPNLGMIKAVNGEETLLELTRIIVPFVEQ